MTVEAHCATIGAGNQIDDANQRGLACAVGTQQTVDAPLGHIHVHVVQCHVAVVLLDNLAHFDEISHIRISSLIF